MISAMPAVALRRERRKSQVRALSRDGSIAFGDRRFSTADFDRRLSEESRRRSSVLSTRVMMQRKEYEVERRKSYLMQSAAVCITTGLIIILLAVILNAPALFTVSFIMISMGSLFFLMRFFMGLENTSASQGQQFEGCRDLEGHATVRKSIPGSSFDAQSEGQAIRTSQVPDLRAMDSLCVTSLSYLRRNSYDPQLKHAELEVANSFSQAYIRDPGHKSAVKPRRGSSGDSGVDLSHVDRFPGTTADTEPIKETNAIADLSLIIAGQTRRNSLPRE